jgi:hydroxymethylglutaryl-CoA lyase
MNHRVQIVEVAPRDGLQNETARLTLPAKQRLLQLLAEAGLRHIEVGAFVRPDRVPQMADTEALCAALPPAAEVTWSALVPNQRGLDRALAFEQLREIALFMAVSGQFNQQNIGMSTAQSLEVCASLIPQIREAGRQVRIYLSTVVWCPYSGYVAPQAVAEAVLQLVQLGPDQISLGETLGRAAPDEVERMLTAVLETCSPDILALHLHNTNGRALESVQVGLRHGITTFDASAGGTGGCPFAPGAAGNLSTEALVSMLHREGYQTGVDLDRLAAAAEFLLHALGRA